MHTRLFHESGLSAKVSVDQGQVKLTIPAPTSPTKLINVTYVYNTIPDMAELFVSSITYNTLFYG